MVLERAQIKRTWLKVFTSIGLVRLLFVTLQIVLIPPSL